MDANQIKVNAFTNVTMQSLTEDALSSIERAKALLKSHGYYVDNLWQVDDVIFSYECTEQEAQELLDEALTSDRIFSEVWNSIANTARDMNFKKII